MGAGPLMYILSYLPSFMSIFNLSKTCVFFKKFIVRHQIIEKRELTCFHTKKNFNDTNIFFPVFNEVYALQYELQNNFNLNNYLISNDTVNGHFFVSDPEIFLKLQNQLYISVDNNSLHAYTLLLVGDYFDNTYKTVIIGVFLHFNESNIFDFLIKITSNYYKIAGKDLRLNNVFVEPNLHLKNAVNKVFQKLDPNVMNYFNVKKSFQVVIKDIIHCDNLKSTIMKEFDNTFNKERSTGIRRKMFSSRLCLLSK